MWTPFSMKKTAQVQTQKPCKPFQQILTFERNMSHNQGLSWNTFTPTVTQTLAFLNMWERVTVNLPPNQTQPAINKGIQIIDAFDSYLHLPVAAASK